MQNDPEMQHTIVLAQRCDAGGDSRDRGFLGRGAAAISVGASPSKAIASLAVGILMIDLSISPWPLTVQ
jgi:hypothetical protein